MLPELGGVKSAAVAPAAKAKPAEIVVMPASEGATDAVAPAASTATTDAAPLSSARAAAGLDRLSVGFGATSTEAGGLKP